MFEFIASVFSLIWVLINFIIVISFVVVIVLLLIGLRAILNLIYDCLKDLTGEKCCKEENEECEEEC